jgi:Cu+-exporting ATPase
MNLSKNEPSTTHHETAEKHSIVYSETVPPSDGAFRVSMSVGGMTCSACSTSITRALSELTGVSEVAVDVIGKSASIVVDRRELADIAAETIEDCGFEAKVVSIDPLKPSLATDETRGLRTVSLQINGMFCR